MKKLLGFFLIVFISFTAAYAKEKWQDHQHIVIVPKDWQPYYKLDENGKPTGYAIEVFEYVAKDIGLDYKYKIVPSWVQLWEPYEKGEVHIVPDLGISKKRASFSLFSISTNTFDIYLFKRFNSFHINSIEDIKDKIVGVVHRNIAQKVMSERFATIKTKVFKDHFELINALLSGQIDAVAYPKPLMHTTLKNLNIHDKINFFDKPLLEIKRAIGISNKHQALLEPINNSLEKFLKTDKYMQLHEKYFGNPKAIEFTKDEIALYVALVVILIIIIIFFVVKNNLLMGQKKIQQKLDLLREQYSYAFSATNDGIWDWNIKTSTVYFSVRWKNMLGYNDDEIENKFSQWQKLVHPDDIEFAHRQVLQLVDDEVEAIALEFRMLCKDGSYKWILSRGKIVQRDKNNKPLRIVGTHIDLTEKKEYENRLKKLNNYLEIIFNQNPNILFTTNGENLIKPNDKFLKFVGYKTKEEFLKDHECICDFFVRRDGYLPKYQEDGTLWIEYILKNSDTTYKALILKNEKEYIFQINVEQILKGEYLVLMHEISSLEQAQIALQRSNEDLQQFAYIASHDLQEPLRMVSSYLQLIERRYDDKLDDDGHEFIAYAVDGAKRMQQLINGLLQFSRVQTKGVAFQKVDIKKVLNDVQSNLFLSIEDKKATIKIPEKLPRILADERQMIQLFQNIIGNSLKYCDATPAISIDFQENEDDIVFSIKDNGIGIDKEYYDKIFLIFQRLHAKDSKYSGTGIGLAVCKRIMQRHGGDISIESEVGKGSTFYLTFSKKELKHG